jgi:Na+/proline symporter
MYTVFGGSKAVSQTQKHQMIIILGGMIFAFIVIVNKFPPDVSLVDAFNVAGKMDKLNVVNFKFDISDKYNIWSGMIAGTFLFLSYFGTDQSQVQRYLGGKSLTESRLGLLFNGLIKVPMQFLVLLVGIMVFMFYQFNPSPLHFNPANVEHVRDSGYAEEYANLERELSVIQQDKSTVIHQYLDKEKADGHLAALPIVKDFNELLQSEKLLRTEAKSLIAQMDEDDPTIKYETEDTDYVFISFITDHLPIGLIGLLLAVIFSAAMSSTASELSALATTSLVDIYKRSFRSNESDKHYLRISKLFTVIWGMIALGFAAMASLFDNLIEAVNIIGSIFYGTILGVFVAAFFFKKLKGTPVFIAALIAEVFVIIVYTLDHLEIIEFAYLWLNLLGCIFVILFAYIIQSIRKPAI